MSNEESKNQIANLKEKNLALAAIIVNQEREIEYQEIMIENLGGFIYSQLGEVPPDPYHHLEPGISN